MSSDWGFEYVGPKKKKKRRSPQQVALRARLKAGLRMAKPEETRQRVEFIVELMRDGRWKGRLTIECLATKWDLSVSRIEQLVSEAKRTVNRG